ncbi:MAG: flagellar brake domain-containing protein [Vulcanimicrobiota bacterium]
MLGFLFGKKGKFNLQPGMLVEIERKIDEETYKSYFCEVLDATQRKARIQMPTENNRPVKIAMDEKVKCIALIGSTLFEVNMLVKQTSGKDFEAIISKKVNSFDTMLTKMKKEEKFSVELEFPLDFRAISTSHLQRGKTKTISEEYVHVVTNLPVPEGTDLKVIFRIPDSPEVETEARSEKSEQLDEDSKKSKTQFTFTEKSVGSEEVEQVKQFVIHYQRRIERRPIPETEELPPPRKEV